MRTVCRVLRGNQRPANGDCCHVEIPHPCERARDAWSAHVDDEAGALEWRAAEQHVERCGACAAWCDTTGAIARRMRVRPAESVPDLSAAILARVHPARPGRGDWVR